MKYKEKSIEKVIQRVIDDGWCPNDYPFELEINEDKCNSDRDCLECWKEALSEQ